MGFVNTCVLTDSMEWRGSWPLLLFVLAVFNEHKGSTWIAWCAVFVGTERGVSQIRLAQGGTPRRMALRGIGVSLVWVHEQWRLWLPHLRSPWQWTSRQPRGMGETSANFLCPFQESKVFPHLDFPDHTPLGGSSETEGPDAEAWDCSHLQRDRWAPVCRMSWIWLSIREDLWGSTGWAHVWAVCGSQMIVECD